MVARDNWRAISRHNWMDFQNEAISINRSKR
jgi:hypothetical protein